MNKQEQIEEMEKIIDELYNVYDTTAGDIAEGLYNAGYRKEQETAKEIEQLKAENDKYAELFKMKDKDFFTITVEDWKKVKSGVLAQIKQAKIDVLNELKAKSYVNDYCREVVEVEKIDKMIKELIK